MVDNRMMTCVSCQKPVDPKKPDPGGSIVCTFCRAIQPVGNDAYGSNGEKLPRRGDA